MENRLRSAAWTPVTSRVLRLAGTPECPEQQALAAVLDAGQGAVVSHESAAALWRLPGFELKPLVVSRPRIGTKRKTPLASLHHPISLPVDHVTTKRGIPVTTLVRTVFDLAGAIHPDRAERALHAALRAGLSWTALERHLVAQARQGRDGISLMRQLIENNRGKAALGSGLEVRFLRLLTDAGLPEPRRQVDVGAEGWMGRVDFLYDDVGLVLEVDGAWTHTTEPDVSRDRHRMARLVAAGYTVLPVPEQLIRRAPHEVVRLVRRARSRLV